jgi:ketosteroid isomerase-like protein
MTRSPHTRFRLPLLVALLSVAPHVARAQGIEEPRIPLRTAINEITSFRSEYEAAINRKDVKALTAMYAPDAVELRPDGSTLLGQEAIGKALAEEAPNWGQMTLSSDTLRVFGHTAWDMGTLTSQRADGGKDVTHYLVVLRRGMKDWKLSSLAVVANTRATATK